nr:MAG TPA: hypothetical protein [Caudoviricetes sp.]
MSITPIDASSLPLNSLLRKSGSEGTVVLVYSALYILLSSPEKEP